MGFLDLFRRAPPVAQPAADPPWVDAEVRAADLGGVSPGAGLIHIGNTARLPRRGTAEILLAYERSPYLQAAIRKISANASAVPLRAFARTTRGRQRRNGSIYVRDASVQSLDTLARVERLKSLRASDELAEVPDHPLLECIARPCPGLTGRKLLRLTFAWLDLVGEAFWLTMPGAGAIPSAFLPIPPHWVRELPTRDRPVFRVQIDGRVLEVPIDAMIWFRDPSLLNPYGRGVGSGTALGDELDADENAAKHVGAYFYNRAMPDMIVSVEGADETALRAAKAKFENEHRGVTKAHRSAFLSGKATVQRLDSSFSDMDLVDLRKFSGRDVVINALGLSPEMLGVLEDANRASVKEARAMFAENVLVPRLDLVLDTLQAYAETIDERLILSFDDPRPNDHEFALKVATVRPRAFSDNEIRMLAAHEPTEAGEVRTNDVDSLRNVLEAVSGGRLARDAAAALIRVAWPTEADALIKALPLVPLAPPSTTPPAPPAEPEDDDEPEDDEPEDDDEPEEKPKRRKPKDDEPEDKRAAPIVRKALDDDGIDNVLESLRPERLTADTYDVLAETMTEIGEAEAAGVGAAGTFSMLNPLITSYLADYSTTKIKGLVNETTREALRATLIEGTRAGEDVRKLAKRVREVFDDADKRRSVVIARTEVIGSANRAIYAAHVMSGVVAHRQWVGTPDGRSRDSHNAAAGSILPGQVRAIGEKFRTSAGREALHPHGFGVASEDIQCRCTTIPLVDIEPRSAVDLEIVWRDFQARLAPNEERFTNAIRDGFRRQREDVLDALERAAAEN